MDATMLHIIINLLFGTSMVGLMLVCLYAVNSLLKLSNENTELKRQLDDLKRELEEMKQK